MPELPDITLYIEALHKRIRGASLTNVNLRSPFFLRSVKPDLSELTGSVVDDIKRMGKRIAIGMDTGQWLVIHLMIAGRLQWYSERPGRGGRNVLADFVFDTGCLRVTEAGTKKRASLHVVAAANLADHNPGGLEIIEADLDQFRSRLQLRNHTLRRALTDPRLFSGIGNAYSDEILHAAGLSPLAMTQGLDEQSIQRLFDAVRNVLTSWTDRLRIKTGTGFPTRVTAFREGMAVHGRFGQPCPVCQTSVQRIRYVSNETNYCPRCQTGGKILADRSLSRLLKKDWPRTIEELEGL
ncbi:MAG: formamidopyrimidine-DNA glycosylase [Gammaproteobacteria bacterium]|nr:formamidopyrimidine-DNA glycosylase [Gammaproteobacteria bacterium]